MSQARTIAANLLSQIQDGRHTLDHLLNSANGQIQRLNRFDRALVHALVYGVLRWQIRLDWIIDKLAARNIKMDPVVRIILRLGVFQLLFLQRIPASAAVNTSVELAKKIGRPWAAGFVNGLLRQAIRRTDQLDWPDVTKDPEGFLSITHAVPLWLINRWIGRWGRETTDRFCQAINMVPNITVRTNTLKACRKELKEAIACEAESIQETPYSPEGLCFEHLSRPLPRWHAFQNGWFQIQSEAAQIISHCLAPQPGQRVWDACAGLGTKTAHLAQLMTNRGQIFATDLRADKLKQLDAEMTRLGITIVQGAHLDLTAPGKEFQTEKFDRILVDAPCSGLGVLQKNPDGKWRVTLGDIQNNGKRQLAMIETAARHLKTNGVLLYAVCSLEPEENERVVDEFLQKHPKFGIHPIHLEGIGNDHPLLTPRGFLKTIPYLHKMDGFFAAALTKRSDLS